MKQPAAMPLQPGGLNTAVSLIPRDLSETQPVPESTCTESRLESVVRYFLGLASTRDVDVVSRILRSLDADGEQALVFAHMSAQADEAVLALALAGRGGTGKRYTSWSVVVRRAHASRFHQWCQSRDLNIIQTRLHYGIMK